MWQDKRNTKTNKQKTPQKTFIHQFNNYLDKTVKESWKMATQKGKPRSMLC